MCLVHDCPMLTFQHSLIPHIITNTSFQFSLTMAPSSQGAASSLTKHLISIPFVSFLPSSSLLLSSPPHQAWLSMWNCVQLQIFANAARLSNIFFSFPGAVRKICIGWWLRAICIAPAHFKSLQKSPLCFHILQTNCFILHTWIIQCFLVISASYRLTAHIYVMKEENGKAILPRSRRINSAQKNVNLEGYTIFTGGVTLQFKTLPLRTGFNWDQGGKSRNSS